MLMRRPLLLLCSFLLGASCRGQAPSAPKGVTVGAPNKSVYAIFQDRKGTYWFGTRGDGLYRYDGQAFTHFSTGDGLCYDDIRGIQQDSRGHLFFNTLKGISQYDGQRFRTLPVAASGEWKLDGGDLWFASDQNENGAYRYDGRQLYHLEFPKHYLEDDFYRRLPNPPYNPYQVYTTYKDRSGAVWLGTSTFGVCRYDGKSRKWLYERHLSHVGEEGSFGIRSILEDRAGKFWFCNTKYRFALRPDRPGSNDSGMLRYDREEGIAGMRSADGEPVYYFTIVEDTGGDLWMATYTGGIWRYHPATGTVSRYPVEDKSRPVNVRCMYQDRRGVIWLGTEENGAYRFNGTAFERFR